ncbi:MAG: helix-turn-helix transcriptional regulator [Deltaproteobacteria bacterium]|nr:helix-turn-helix transcriptional regulator [Deltaproteobacteria bacterium]
MKKRERLRRARTAAGLSQAGLARLVGTSQQQIQRIEAGNTIRLDLAMRIAAALKVDLGAVFPEVREIEEQRQRQRNSDRTSDAPIVEGVDADIRIWTLRLRLRSGVERDFVLPSADVSRFGSYMTGETRGGMIFDSEDAEVYVNFDHVLFAHLMWDPPHDEPRPVEPQEAGVTVWFHSQEPTTFEVTPEGSDPYDDQGEATTLRSLLTDLDMGAEGQTFISFLDGDGERVYLRVAEIELLEVSHASFADIAEDDPPESHEPSPTMRSDSSEAASWN